MIIINLSLFFLFFIGSFVLGYGSRYYRITCCYIFPSLYWSVCYLFQNDACFRSNSKPRPYYSNNFICCIYVLTHSKCQVIKTEVGQRMHGIGNHGGTVSEDAGDELERQQGDIPRTSQQRNFVNLFFPCHGHCFRFAIRTRMYDQTSLNSLEISVLVLLFQILFVQRLADFILLELPFVFIRGSGKPDLRDSIFHSLHLGSFDAESHR